ncbi:MAG: DUF4040 domain-containing protein [Thermodesulfobacteriota bacterium]
MIDMLLVMFIVVFAVAAVMMRDLLSATIILGAYSLVMALVWTRLNAVDVAFTEASVGAGITTVLMLAALSRSIRGEDHTDARHKAVVKSGFDYKKFFLFIMVVFTFGVLVYGTLDMPDFGDPNAPAHRHVADRYIEKSHEEVGVENFVTAILASYRGYDTLGETTVIFTAGLSVVLLLRRRRRRL